MRLYFVNRFYWPAEPATAQLLGDLAEGLVANAWKVSVVTGRHIPGLPDREQREGVEVHRVGPAMVHTQNLGRRAIDFIRFRRAAEQFLRVALRPGDIVVALTDPPLIGNTASEAAEDGGARTVHWIHDIYPEIAHAVGANPASALLNVLLRPGRNAAWRKAAACVTLGDEMAQVVRAAGVAPARLHVVANWAPRGLTPAAESEVKKLRRAWVGDERFVIGYSGNLGRVHDVDGLLDVASQLQSNPGFVFLFIGGGAGFTRIQGEAARRGLGNVQFRPPQPRGTLAVSLAVPDLHVVSLREGCERFVFPSKVYGVAAAGRPILMLGAPDSEVARMITTRGAGSAFRPRDTASIAGYIRDLARRPEETARLGVAARRFDAESGGWRQAVAAWDTLLRKLDVPA